jgi:hypothetical protein
MCRRQFSKEEVQKPPKYMKKCLTSSATRKMQIKMALTPIKIPIIKKIYNSKCS